MFPYPSPASSDGQTRQIAVRHDSKAGRRPVKSFATQQLRWDIRYFISVFPEFGPIANINEVAELVRSILNQGIHFFFSAISAGKSYIRVAIST